MRLQHLSAMAPPDNFLQDVRQSFRQFRRSPGFTATAVVVLGLGLGANAAIFSMVDAMLLHTVPFPDPSRLVVLYERDVDPVIGRASVSYADYQDWRDQNRTLETLAIARETSFNLADDRGAGQPERVDGVICSWTLLQALKMRPKLGRAFTAADDQPGAPRVAVIGYGLWQRRFAGRVDVLSRHLRLDAQDYAIIGVMPPGFAYPAADLEVWVPALPSLDPKARTHRGWRQFHGLGRLRAGISIDQARLELNGIAQRIKSANPDMPLAAGVEVLPLEQFATRHVRTALLVLLGAVGCVLLIACMNIANLLLARASRRQREMAIRSAIGASRVRIVRQLLTESLMLAAAGAGFGLLLASFCIDALKAAVPALLSQDSVQPTGEIHLDAWVFLFTASVAALAGVAVGIIPALQVSRTDLTSQLKDGNRSTTSGAAQSAFRRTLVAAEVALSMVLLVCAGLLLRSFAEIRAVRTGVRIDNLLTAGVSLPVTRYPDDRSVATFADELRRRLVALPGVRSADVSTCRPIDGCGDQFFAIDGHPLPRGHMLDANIWAVSPGFFTTMGIPIVRGRAFTDRDRASSGSKRSVAVINQAMARQFWPGENPIGQTIVLGDSPDDPRFEVIGICGDVVSSLDQKPEPAFFLLHREWRDFYAVVATKGAPDALAITVRRVIASLDPDVPAYQVRTMREVAESSSANRRLSALLIGLFAATAMLLSAIGLYGVLAYLVAQRTGEIGIRMVLGATSTEVKRLVLKQGMWPVAGGLVAGWIAALAATQLLRSFLFGVTATDLPTFVAASILLAAVAMLACLIPASRAGGVDPAVALRSE